MMAREVVSDVCRSACGSETRSGDVRAGAHTRDPGKSLNTWTSFSPSATLAIISRRAALSGLGFFRYSALRMSSSSLL
jgi:hypothetical protein